MDFEIVYSDRRTVAITVRNGIVNVKSPYGISRKRLETVVDKNKAWINKQLVKSSLIYEITDNLDKEKIKKLKSEAKDYFVNEVTKFSEITGLKPSRITITGAKTRFGSCNSRGGVCFSYLLMFYPPEAREYVVMHELAHLRHMNHSRDFYKLIEEYMPDYKTRKRLLKN